MSRPRFFLPGLALVLLAGLTTVGACNKTGSAPAGFGVNVTVDATMVPSAQRAMITTDKLTVISDKAGATPVVRTLDDLPKAIAGGTVRFHYTPGGGVSAGDKLSFGLDVMNGSILVASGSGGPVTLETGAVSLTITLASGNNDGGPGSDGGKGNGTACVTDGECGSGFCADGVCCNERCDDVCVSCKLPTTMGTCTPYAAGVDPEMECAAKLPPPVMDTDAGSTTTDAGGGAEAGDASSGDAQVEAGPGAVDADDSDALVINTPDGGIMSKPALCGGACSGARSCNYPDKTKSCGTSFCNTRKQVASFTCDGNGGCAIAVGDCAKYTCNDAMGTCQTQCADHVDCQLGFYCDGATHMCVEKKGIALTCATDDECKLGHCSSGVCCNTACNTAPLSCNSTGSVGQCKCAECPTGPCQIFYPDVDGDGFGDRTATYALHTAQAACAGMPPVGHVADNTDCDDGDANAHPGQTMFFGVQRKSGGFDYDCDEKTTKETPEYVNGFCKFCGAVGSCDATGSTCAAANQTASFVCPQESSGGIIRTASEPEPNLSPLREVGLAGGDSVTSYASVAPGAGSITPIQPPICKFCVLQCCGCAAADKTGFRQMVSCGETAVPQYTCGSCSVAGGAASAMTPSFKQQRCR